MRLVSSVPFVIIFALLCFRFCTDDSSLSVISLNHYLLTHATIQSSPRNSSQIMGQHQGMDRPVDVVFAVHHG